MKNRKIFDVIIIGGSYAGLSAAMALGRSLKEVLIIDSGKPCNRFTPHSHNFITHDGDVPGHIAALAKEQVLKYKSVTFIEGKAVNGNRTDAGFEISVQSGQTFQAKKLLFAAGIKDIFPTVTGFEACWGKSVIHCPYCHGYEFKNQKTAIIANGERAFHIASLVNNLTDKIRIVTQGNPAFKDDQLVKLAKNNISIIEKKVHTIEHQEGQIQALTFSDGTTELFEVAYAAIPFEQHCTIPNELGCERTENGHLKVDMMQKTNIPGVYACGDCTSPMRSVANAVATGNFAGAMINTELTMESF